MNIGFNRDLIVRGRRVSSTVSSGCRPCEQGGALTRTHIRMLFLALATLWTTLFADLAVADNQYFQCQPSTITEWKEGVVVSCTNLIELTAPNNEYTDRVSLVGLFSQDKDKIKRFEDMAISALNCGLQFIVLISEERNDNLPTYILFLLE